MTHSVRLLTREDAAGVHALHARCFPPDEAWSAWSFRDTLALPTTIGLATEAGERLSGMILAQNTPPDADILTMCVDPDYRRAGLATDLLNGLVRLLGPYGVNRLCLDVAADNGAATAFYESSGFLADGRRRNYYERSDGTQVDAVPMSRSIAGQANESEA